METQTEIIEKPKEQPETYRSDYDGVKEAAREVTAARDLGEVSPAEVSASEATVRKTLRGNGIGALMIVAGRREASRLSF
jgi:hypothetical protein